MISLKEIIAAGSDAYPENLVLRSFEGEENVGDGLAEFIAREIKDLYDESADDNVNEESIVTGLARAVDEMESVRNAILVRFNEERDK